MPLGQKKQFNGDTNLAIKLALCKLDDQNYGNNNRPLKAFLNFISLTQWGYFADVLYLKIKMGKKLFKLSLIRELIRKLIEDSLKTH